VRIAKPIIQNLTVPLPLSFVTAQTRQHLYLLLPLPVVSIVAGLVYYLTAAPGLSWYGNGEDGGDLATAVVEGGIAHPTGYPLYLLIAKAGLLLSYDPARALNLFSALTGALGAGFFGLAATLFYRRVAEITSFTASLAGLFTGLSVAFAPLVWTQALITEVYSLNLALTGLCLLSLAIWQTGQPGGLEMVALSGGLAVGHHRTAILTLFAGGLFLLLVYSRVSRPELRRITRQALRALALFLAALILPYLYLLFLSNPAAPFIWYKAGPDNLDGFWQLVTAADYRQYFLAVPLPEIPGKLAAAAGILQQQFGWPGLFLGLFGFIRFWHKREAYPFLALFLSGFVFHLVFAATYNASGSQNYLIPAFGFWAMAAGFGMAVILSGLLSHRKFWLILSLALVLPLLSLAINYSRVDLSSERQALEWLSSQLQDSPPGAVLLSGEDRSTFTLWYGLYVQKKRPDLAVVDTRLLYYDWYRQTLKTRYPDLVTILPEHVSRFTPAGCYAPLTALNPARVVVILASP
jgi:hypothetical protein